MPNNAEKMNKYVETINAALDDLLPESDKSIVCRAMRYSVENGGKRIRPVLTLEFCRLCGGKTEDAVPLACAVEMIHAYSLIHDDLPCMDDDDLRRGKPSCHIEFGEANALLAGDALLTLAFEIIFRSGLEPAGIVEAGTELADAAGWDGMIGGQVMDLENEGTPVSPEKMLATDHKKTGRLIMAAAVLGCIAAGASKDKKDAAALYARNIGLAFQLVDDILDITGDTAVLGKPAGSDNENNKATYASSVGLKASQTKVEELNMEAKSALGIFGGESGFLLYLADILAKRNK